MAHDPARGVPDLALLALAQVLFGALSVAGKVAIPQVGAWTLMAVRIGCAALILLALERWLVGHRVERRDLGALAVLSLLGVVLNQLFYLSGLALTTAVEATVLITTIPVFTLAVGLAWGRDRWDGRKALGMAVAFAGVVLLVGASALEFGSATFLGNLFVVINALSYAVYLVASRPVLARIPPLTLTAYTFALGALFALPFGVAGLPEVAPGKPDLAGLGAIAFIILGPSVTTYFLISHALVRMPASTVAGFIYLQPLVAGVLAVLLLGEPITLRIVGAGALIFLGVGLVAFDARVFRPRRLLPGA